MSLTEYAADSGTAIEHTPADEPDRTTFEVLGLASIATSLTNPRKSFDQAKLQELADSIKASGVHQPVLVRPLPASRLEDTFTHRRPGDPLASFELVLGERRYRASKLAGLDTIPAIIRPLTDAQALEAQIVENLQRDDLAPLEEAEGYQALIAATGVAKEDIGARIGRSRTFVYGRLKLLDLCPEAAAALRSGTIDASRALVIARIPDTQLQMKALEEASRKDWQGNQSSYRSFLSWAQSNVMLKLSEARFKITDASLVPAAGSCKDCHKRTGANPDLFADVASADVCTDPTCYQGKVEAHDAAMIAQAQQNGQRVILGKEAKKIWGSEYGQLDGFTRLDKPDSRVDYKKPLSKVLGKDAPVPTLIVHPSSGELVAVVATDELDKALKAKGLITPAQASAKSKMTKEEDARNLLAKVEKTWRKAAIAKVHELGSGRSPLGLSVPLCKLIALRLVPSLRGDERAVYGELFGIGKVAQREGIEDHVRACTADNIDLVCMVLLSLHDMLYLVQYQDGKASPTPHIDAVAADLEIDLQVIKDQVKELLKPKAKKPAAVATKKAATKPGAMDIKYRGPNGETWTGRGQQPAWVKAALKRGQTLQQLLNAAARKDVTSAAEAQAGIAAALQQLPADPVKPAPAGKKVKGAKS